MLIELVLLVLVIAYYVRRRRRYETFWKHVLAIPGPKTIPILGNKYKLHTPESYFLQDRKDSNEFFPIFRSWCLDLGIVSILNPEDVELVLNNTKHNTKSFVYELIHEWLGTGLITSGGTKWHNRRKIITPAFHFTILQEFVDVLNNETDILVDNLKVLCKQPFVDVTKPISDFTLNSIGETSLGITLRDNPDCVEYKHAVHSYGESFAHRFVRPWLYYSFIYELSSLYKKNIKLLDVLHKFSKNILNKKKESNHVNGISTQSYSTRKKLALLDLLLKAKANGADIDDEGIKEEADTFIFAGHDTTSISLCFALMSLANEPKIQEEVYQEIISVVGESHAPTFQELGELKFMERCIKEVLRIYPSVPIIGRIAGEDIKTKTGYTIPQGCFVHLHIIDMHRRPEYYENPEKFDPDRFLPDNIAKRHPYAYIPFSAGSRNCIGQKFALLEIKIALCGILRKFKLEAVTKPENLVYKCDMVLRPSCEIKVKFVPRT